MAFRLKRVWAFAAIAALALTGAASSQPARGGWAGVWGASPLPPTLVAGPFAPVSPSFNDQTLRQVVRVNGGGSEIRIRFTNEYSAKALAIGEVHVALSAGPGGAVVPGSDHVVTFSGSKSATIPAFSPMLSDPIAIDVKPLSSLAVSLYVAADSGPCTCHQVAAQTGYLSGPGNFTGAATLPNATTFLYRAFLSGVEARGSAKAIVAFGDSLTDGAVSTNDANHRWPDRLAERLNLQAPGKWGVINQGISGNRLLAGGAGEAGLARFDRDVLSVPGVSAVIVLLGTNDLGVGYGPLAPAPPRPRTHRPMRTCWPATAS